VLPALPVRPGAYTWRVSLYEANGDLVDYVDYLPEMIVAIEPVAHFRDESAGVLNLPTEFSISSGVEVSQ
jgi:hypothetical protein